MLRTSIAVLVVASIGASGQATCAGPPPGVTNTLQRLEDLVAQLRDEAPLEVRALAFCTAIHSYGIVDQFESYRFEAGQEVLLYCEVKSFQSEATDKGYRTAFRGSYDILDRQGRRLFRRKLDKCGEYCRNRRRDYFIAYRFRLPERIAPGKYTLQLTVRDLKSRKVGQSSVRFAIKRVDRGNRTAPGKRAASPFLSWSIICVNQPGAVALLEIEVLPFVVALSIGLEFGGRYVALDRDVLNLTV